MQQTHLVKSWMEIRALSNILPQCAVNMQFCCLWNGCFEVRHQVANHCSQLLVSGWLWWRWYNTIAIVWRQVVQLSCDQKWSPSRWCWCIPLNAQLVFGIILELLWILLQDDPRVPFLSCRCSGCVSSNLGLCVRCVQAHSKKVSKIALANRFRFIK